MASNTPIERSPIDHILNAFYDLLNEDDSFTSEIISGLKQLSEEGKLGNPEAISRILKRSEEKEE